MRYMVAGLLLASLAATAEAQVLPRATVAAEAGLAFPLGQFRDDGAGLGWMAGLTGTWRVRSPVALYVTAERTTFGVEDAPAGDMDHWTDTGFGAGLRLWLPLGAERRWLPWVQLGAAWHDTDAPLADSAFAVLDTDGIVTLDAAAGVDVALPGRKVMLRPALKYRRYRYELRVDEATSRTSVSWLTLGLGFVLPLGSADPGS